MRDVGVATHRALLARSDAGRLPAVAVLALGSPECQALEDALVEAGFEVRHAPSGGVVPAVPADAGPDALLMLGGGAGATEGMPDAVAALCAAGWDHVVVVGGDTRATVVGRAMAMGARGFLVAARSPTVVPAPAAAPAEPAGSAMPVSDVAGRERRLSAREVQVLALAADGLSNPEIAQRLGLSALTIKSHLSRMTRRLGARDRAHLVLLALRAGVIA